jgi:hypothetical protein
MKTKKILIKSADISTERMAELYDAVPKNIEDLEGQRAVSAKNALSNLLFAVGLIVGEILLFLIVSKFGMPASPAARIGFLILFIGGISLILRLIFASLYEFLALSKSILKKEPEAPKPSNLWIENSEQAIRRFFEFVLIGNKKLDFDEQSVQDSYQYLLDTIPRLNVELSEFNNYLTDFRKAIRQSAESVYKEVFDTSTTPEICISQISFDFAVMERTVATTHMSKTKVKVTLSDAQSDANSTFVQFDINLELLLIKSGNFWFVADPMPEYTFEDTEDKA